MQNLKQSSDSSNPDPDVDLDVLPEYSNFKDPWSKIQNLDDSQFLLVSQEDFKELTNILRNSQDLRKEIEELKQKEQKV